MLRCILNRLSPSLRNVKVARHLSDSGNNSKDERNIFKELNLTGVHMDEIEEIMSDVTLHTLENHYPRLELEGKMHQKPMQGHNLMVIQPWESYANFNSLTDPEIQLEECVSLGNTIQNWNVVEKKIIFMNQMHRKQLVGKHAFEDLKETILGCKGISAVFFGLELLSGVQLSTLEHELKMPVFDRFTVVLNIFRQHAKTKEAKIQLALAELPYIRSHLREIHESSEYSSAAESLKNLIGGIGEKFYKRRLDILKRREARLRSVLDDLRKQREITKRLRRRSNLPVVSVVGYTNSGKTSLIKYLTNDENLIPEDKLFATLDVTVHAGQLPSSKLVLYVDTVGFISRIPLLLVEAFAATLREVHESDLIVHILDASHPDHQLQYATVIKALHSLKIPKDLMDSRLTIGNKIDKLDTEKLPETLPKCELNVSVTNNTNMQELADVINLRLMDNLKHEVFLMRVDNGGPKYSWLKKNATITECEVDSADANYLICRVIMSPTASGRWSKRFGQSDVLSRQGSKVQGNES